MPWSTIIYVGNLYSNPILVNIFEWNFQEDFLIEINWKWMYSGWVWPPFDASHAHFPKTYFLKKGPQNQQILNISKIFFFISGSNFIRLFNGTLFVFIISVVADTQKETFLPVHFNWPPLYKTSWKIDVPWFGSLSGYFKSSRYSFPLQKTFTCN